MTTVRAIIQMLQAYDEDDTIEELLNDSKFVQEITESIKLLPKAKSILSQIIRNQNLPAKEDTNQVLNSIRKVTNIELPGEVLGIYKECQQNPLRFWSWAGIQLDLTADETKPIEFFFRETYLGINRLETQRIWDTIIWRFFVLFFYDLVKIFGKTYLTISLENKLIDILSSTTSIHDTTTKIQENLRRWIAAGSHYSQLSDSLGYGAPFLLPLSVADSTWEKKLPLKGPIYKSAVEHLESKSFREKSTKLGADALGAEIRESILKPFRWNLSTFERSIQSSSYRHSTNIEDNTYQLEEAFHNHRESGTEAESRTFGIRSTSINALLNPAEPTQSQQLLLVKNLSVAIGSEAGLSGYEQGSTIGEHAEFGSSKGEKRGLESQAEACDSPSKQRRIVPFSGLDLSLSQPTNGITHDQGGAIGNSISERANSGAVMYIAEMAELCKLESILGAYLFNNLQQEKQCEKYTYAIRLHFADCPGGDFKLEIWLCSSIRQAILQVKMGLFEDLRNTLGDYLFEGMKTSNWRKEEEAEGKADCTDAVNIVGDDENDCKMEVMLGFEAGINFHNYCFLS
ncbi:hypothetical protein OCU04_009809 [Sclerotinia nivalis]|uniref:Uncharacterized protein n=1 Tax=Sclerotinia nivalis TaxID=352851 RepID=A0A9X0DII0_9HELO|nr:hypothetical protein OCU04_009809 [Sclerotinia nivalis]